MDNITIKINAKPYADIEAGIKTEAYCPITDAWTKKFCQKYASGECKQKSGCFECIANHGISYVCYNTVTFQTGRKGKSMTFNVDFIKRSPDENGDTCFTIKLGEKINEV